MNLSASIWGLSVDVPGIDEAGREGARARGDQSMARMGD